MHSPNHRMLRIYIARLSTKYNEENKSAIADSILTAHSRAQIYLLAGSAHEGNDYTYVLDLGREINTGQSSETRISKGEAVFQLSVVLEAWRSGAEDESTSDL